MKKLGEIDIAKQLARQVKPLTPIQQRLTAPMDQDVNEIVYQHSVLCQTSMPYRDPGDIRLWSRRNGIVKLELQAGRVMDPTADDFVDVGLPFGPKARLVLLYLNAEALRTRSPILELEDSLTAFVKRTLGLDGKGRNIRIVKDQLTRLAATDFRLGASDGRRAVTVKGTVINGLELWTPRDPRQKVLWPTTVRFSFEYFESLMQHAVPLSEDHLARLSHTAMGLDIYAWLAQRLHRVDPRKPGFVPWTCLQDQFGQGYDRIRDFRRRFGTALKQVRAVYRDAKVSINDRGMTLHNSPPPVPRRDSIPGFDGIP
jgi:hypothetical protein